MQFKVPQDVQREDRIVGPLTLKQMIICGVGGFIAYAIYVALGKTYIWITWFPPVALVTIVTIAFAFIRPLNMSFTKWIIRNIEKSLLPGKRPWIKGSAEILIPLSIQKSDMQKKAKTEDESETAFDIKQKKMQELQKFLESQSNNSK